MINLKKLRKILNKIIQGKLNIPIRTEFFVTIAPLLFVYGNWVFQAIFFIPLFLFFFKDKLFNENLNIRFPYIIFWLSNLMWGAYILSKSSVFIEGMYFYVALYVIPFIIFLIIQNAEVDIKFFYYVFHSLIVSGIVISIIHIFLLIETGTGFTKRLENFYLWPNNNILAAYYLIIFFILLSFLMNTHKGENKLFYIISLILISFAIFLTQTRGIWLAIIFAMSIYLFKKPKLFIPITVIFGAIVLIFTDIIITRFMETKNYTTDISSLGRLQAWIATISLLKDNFLTGYGFDSFIRMRDNVYGFYLVPVIHSHNTYLNNLLEIGLIGCIFYYYFLLKSFLINFKIWKSPLTIELRKYSESLFLSFLGLFVAFMFEPYFSVFSSSVIVIWFLIAISFKINSHINIENTVHL